jgi:hypothetical protein
MLTGIPPYVVLGPLVRIIAPGGLEESPIRSSRPRLLSYNGNLSACVCVCIMYYVHNIRLSALMEPAEMKSKPRSRPAPTGKRKRTTPA